MRSILVKDYLENRMYFLILVAAAVISLMLAAWFKQLDPGIALVLLFVMQGPPLLCLIAQNQISSEVKKNTLPFLNSLPISPFKLWLAKLSFSVLFAVALYTVYTVLSLACGVNPDDLYQMFINYPAIGIGIPALALCFGFFNTMLPSEYVALSFLILVPPGVWIAGNLHTLFSLNYNLFTLLLCVMFLVTSASAFLIDNNQNARWRGVKTVSMLVIGLLVFIGIWATLDNSCNSFKPGKEPKISYLRPLNNGSSIAMTVISDKSLLDVISPRHSYYTLKKGLPAVTSIDRLFKTDGDKTLSIQLIDLKDGSLKQIGKRNSYFLNNENNSANNSENSFSRILLSQTTAGFFRGCKSAVIDSAGNIVTLLPGDGTDYDYSKDFFIIDDQRFIYCETIKNGKSELTDYVLYEKGKGLKTIHTTQSDFGFNQFVSVPSKETGKPDEVFIVGASDNHPGSLVFISVPEGRQQVFPVSPIGDILLSSNNMILYKSRRPKSADESRKYDLNLLYLDGRVKKLENLAESAEVIAVSPDGKLITLIPQPTDDPYDSRWQALVEIDHENDSTRELIRFDVPVWKNHYLSRDCKRVLLYTSRRDDKNEKVINNTYSVDAVSGKITELESLKNQRSAAYYENVFATTESKFIINTWSELIEYDLETGNSRSVVSLKDLEARLQKGGAAK